MADSRNAIEEVRARIAVVDLVSEYVTLKRAGKTFKGLCPFHAEKTPSFNVSEELQRWHCFGCGENGDIFTFVMKYDNLTFPEALERLAKRAGVDLQPFQDRQTSRRDSLVEINSLAAEYFQGLLKQNRPVQEYLTNRGLAEQTIEQFMLGYAAPAWDGLVKFLTKKRIQLDDAVEAGLLSKSDKGHFDRFRHRVIFPILDIQKRAIAFGGRALGDDPAKYLNSPETPIFSKTKSLYGLHLARKKISNDECAVIVEGYMDVISAHQAGFTNTVASLGTALTSEQIGALSRYTKNVVLAYDADSAGMKATLRGASMFDEAGCNVRIAGLPDGDDPDSLIRSGKVAQFSAAIADALPIVDYHLILLRKRFDLSSQVGRAAMLIEAEKIIAQIPQSIERERHIRTLARYHPNYESGTTRAEEHLRQDVDNIIRGKTVGESKTRYSPKAAPKPPAGIAIAERALIRVLVEGGTRAQAVLEALSPDDFPGESARAAASIIYEKFGEQRGIYLAELIESADAGVGRFLSELMMRDEGPPVTDQALQDYISALKKWKTKNMRTSDVLAPYISGGAISADDATRADRDRELQAFLKKTGRLSGDAEQ